MARADQDQFLAEWMEGGRGTAADIVAVLTERFRNDQNANVGMTTQQAVDVLNMMGYSDSAMVGLQDILDALKAGVILPMDFESAMMLAEGAWPHHTTIDEIRDRII